MSFLDVYGNLSHGHLLHAWLNYSDYRDHHSVLLWGIGLWTAIGAIDTARMPLKHSRGHSQVARKGTVMRQFWDNYIKTHISPTTYQNIVNQSSCVIQHSYPCSCTPSCSCSNHICAVISSLQYGYNLYEQSFWSGISDEWIHGNSLKSDRTLSNKTIFPMVRGMVWPGCDRSVWGRRLLIDMINSATAMASLIYGR